MARKTILIKEIKDHKNKYKIYSKVIGDLKYYVVKRSIKILNLFYISVNFIDHTIKKDEYASYDLEKIIDFVKKQIKK